MSLQHLILGLLDMQPMSGYDLNRAFEQTAQHFWTTDQSSIYRALYKLRDSAMIAVEHVAQVEHPDKKVYHVTDEGAAELRRWLRTPITDSPPRMAWLGQIFFGAAIPAQDLMQVLTQYRAEVAERLAVLEALEHHLKAQCPPEDAMTRIMRLQLLTLDYGLASQRFEINWLDDALAQIAAWDGDTSSTVAPGDS